MINQLLPRLQTASNQALQWVLPKRCYLCREPSGPFLVPNLCYFCSISLDCPKLEASSMGFVFSLGAYRGGLRKILTQAKFHRNLLCIDILVNLLVKQFRQGLMAELCGRIDVVTSVPSSFWRCFARGVDLPGILAQEMANSLNRPFKPNLLQRTRRTGRQGKLSKAERMVNLNEAFLATPDGQDQNILLIDDIFTTGSTAKACISALAIRKPKAVWFVTAAYTPEDQVRNPKNMI